MSDRQPDKVKILSRKQAINYVARIINNNGFCTVTHEHGKTKNCAWIEVWLVDLKVWIGNLNLTLMGTFSTSNMTGMMRKRILRLIPDDLEIKSTPSEVYWAKRRDYGFWEDE